MPAANDFRTIQVQASVFTSQANFRTSSVVGTLLSKYAAVFDGEPSVLPVPKEFPPEVPRVVLLGKSSQVRLQAGPARVDYVRFGKDLASGEVVAGFLTSACTLFDDYCLATQGTIGRVSCLLHRICPNENPAKEVARHFCKERWLENPLNRPSDFEIHAAKQFNLEPDLLINSWFRCKSAIVNVPPNTFQEKVIFVEQDFNSLAEELQSRVFDNQQIRKFYERALPEFEKVMDRYFPPEVKNNAS